MKKVYEVTIEEVLRTFVKVDAESKEEAIRKVNYMYEDGEITLDSSDFFGVEFFVLDEDE